MALFQFRLPDIGEGVAEAEIVLWHVRPGETVNEDQSLVDVMTDKATVDITSPVDGIVKEVFGEVGAMVPVGSVLVVLEIDGDAAGGDTPKSEPSPPPTPVQAAERSEPEPAREVTPPVSVSRTARSAPSHKAGTQSFAAPATRRRAYELGIPLQFLHGTGPGGRILPSDLDDYLACGDAAPPSGGGQRREGVSEERIVGLRRKIAQRMEEAKRRIPHISYVEEVDVSELEALRQDLNAHRAEGGVRLTLLPFLVLALVRVLPDYPQINAHFDDDAGVLRRFEGVHVGIATQTPAGLMVPVLRHAEALSLGNCAQEIARLAGEARTGTMAREELSGSTITITSLGPLGGIVSTPVINRPEVAIIGPNKIVERPVLQNGQLVMRKVMNLSSSFDHRIVDGYDAALFVQALKRVLEHPALLFMKEPV